MSQRSRTPTGYFRGEMNSDSRREFEKKNPSTGSSDMTFSRPSKASGIFRDHGFEDSLSVPQDQLKRLSFHDLNKADPSDVPLPLNIRKTPTTSNPPQKQEHNSVKAIPNKSSGHPQIHGRLGGNPSTFEEAQKFTGAGHLPSLAKQHPSHTPDYMTSVETEGQLRSDDRDPTRSTIGLPAPCSYDGDIFTTSENGREEDEDFPEPPETNQSPPLRDGVARNLPRQQPIPATGDPEIPSSESVASFDTIAQEHYRYILARRALLGLRRPGDISFAAKSFREPNQGEPVDEVAWDHNESGYLGKLHDQYGTVISGVDPPIQPERPPSSIDSQGMTREEALFARYALTLRQPSSNFSFHIQDKPDPAASPRGRHANIDTDELDAEPCSDIVGAYRLRRARCEAELYDSGDDEYGDREIFDEPGDEVTRPEADNIGTLVEARIHPVTARLRPNLRPFPPTRIPRPVQRTVQSYSLRNEQDVSRDEDVELGVTTEDVNIGEYVPESSKAKENEAKSKAPAKKPKATGQYDSDPWSLMVTGASTPHRAEKKNKKKSETESESHPSIFTPSSRHSKSSKYSDQPSSSDKPGKSTKRGLAKPSPIKSVFRVASGILPKFLHSPSTRSQFSANESHEDSNTDTNGNSDNTSQKEHQQHRITTASSSSSGTRPSTRFGSLTATSPTPFRACSRPELGFPSSPRCNNRGPQFSFFSSLPRSGPGYSTMEPPNRPPPLTPHLRRADTDDQATSNEVAIPEGTAAPGDVPMATSELSATVPQASSTQSTPDEVSTEDVNNEAFIDEVATGDAAQDQAPATQPDSEEAFPCITSNKPSASVPSAISTQSTTTEVATDRITTEAVTDAASSASAITRDAHTEMTRTAVAPLNTDEDDSTESVPQATLAEDSVPATSQAPTGTNATEAVPVEVSSAQTTGRSRSSSEPTSTDSDWSTITSGDTEEEESIPGQSSEFGLGSEEGDEGEGEDSGSGANPSGCGGVAPGVIEEDIEDDANPGAVASASETPEGGDNVPPRPEKTESGGEVDDSESQLPQVAQDLYETVDVVSPAERLESYRKELGCEYVEWTPEAELPMRPGDKRVWYSNNLRCEDCAPDCCVCGKPCCMWNAAEQVLGDDLALEKEKQRALKLMQRLQRVLPVGEEPRTHVLCSSPGGCGGYACPDCAGRCPTTMCRDIQCLNCKEDPWGPCDWHPLDD